MKSSRKLFQRATMALALFTTITLSACAAKTPGMLPEKATDKGFAVLELFTSEGCSSCPPAEALLEQIQQEAEGLPVYILAYHVDYWDHQGWRDPFSDAAFTNRQYAYSQRLSAQVYTPQLVINGTEEGVGSREGFVRKAVTAMLEQPAGADLSLAARKQNGKATVDYTTGGNTKDLQLELVLVQKNGVSQVKRGENEGRTLSHVQIVRGLSTVDIRKNPQGTVTMDLPANFNANDWEIVGLLQNAGTGKIAAAGRTTLLH